MKTLFESLGLDKIEEEQRKQEELDEKLEKERRKQESELKKKNIAELTEKLRLAKKEAKGEAVSFGSPSVLPSVSFGSPSVLPSVSFGSPSVGFGKLSVLSSHVDLVNENNKISEAKRAGGHKGGKGRLVTMTPEERLASSKKANEAKAKKAKLKKSYLIFEDLQHD